MRADANRRRWLSTRLPALLPGLALGCLLAAAASSQSPVLAIRTTARSIQPGELVVYQITAPPDATAVNVTGFGRVATATQESATTWRALVGIDLAVGPGPATTTVTAAVPTGTVTDTHVLTVLGKAFPTRRLRVNPALVEPPPEALDRIRRESARTDAIFQSPASEVLWSGGFVRPVQEPANSRFGSQSIFNKTRSSPHAGADFLSPSGTPIKSPAGGRVRLAAPLYFSGNTVIVDHGLGLFSLFAHLSGFAVAEGDTVASGAVLGRVGATGRVTGPHLHWAVRINGARIDPLSLLAMLGQP